MEMKEYILCAAIHWDDGKEYIHQPVNIKTGIVVCGRRHHNVFNSIFQMFDRSPEGKVMQGFITNTDRFVSRMEAGKIAFEAGQIKRETDTLFSEDLY